MEQNTLVSPLTASPLPAPPPPRVAPATDRCAHLSPTGRRCRSNSADPLHGLCHKHATQKATDPDSADLSADLFGHATPSFDSIEEINASLKNLVILVAQGRISSRRAGVIVYALSFILRGLQVIDRKAAVADPQITMDIDCAVGRWAKEQAQPRAQQQPQMQNAQTQASTQDSVLLRG